MDKLPNELCLRLVAEGSQRHRSCGGRRGKSSEQPRTEHPSPTAVVGCPVRIAPLAPKPDGAIFCQPTTETLPLWSSAPGHMNEKRIFQDLAVPVEIARNSLDYVGASGETGKDSRMIIGDRLRAMREEKQLSQGDVENRTGLLRCY